MSAILIAAVIAAGGSRPAAGAADTVALHVHAGVLPAGALDGITDVPGVLVAHVTKIAGADIRDGATAVVPNADPWLHKVAAATYTINGNGALTNRDWVDESGRLETPVVLVGNTLDVGRAYDGVITAMIRRHPDIGLTADVPLPVIGEIDGQRLNAAPVRAVSAADVVDMIARAHGGQFARGSVGAGTPATAFGYKAGIGSSSRVLRLTRGTYTVGVLVNANMDLRDHLHIAGLPVGRALPHDDLPRRDVARAERGRAVDGSIIIVVATDAPLDAGQLHALAARAAAGLYRTGSISRVSSGDQVIAFSTARVHELDPRTGEIGATNAPEITDEMLINALYQATAEATESAVDDALLAAHTMTGNGAVVHALPQGRLRELLQRSPFTAEHGGVWNAP